MVEYHLLNGRVAQGFANVGSFWQRGELAQTALDFAAQTDHGLAPTQTRATSFWPDGSVKSAVHVVDATAVGDKFTLVPTAVPPSKSVTVTETAVGYQIDTGVISALVPKAAADWALQHVCLDGQPRVSKAYPVLTLAQVSEDTTKRTHYQGHVDEAALEVQGPLEVVVKLTGSHHGHGRHTMPFTLRLAFHAGSAAIDMTQTFFYDGDEQQDQLAGMGLRFETNLQGGPDQRHVQFLTDGQPFHETAVLLHAWHPSVAKQVLQDQLAGAFTDYSKASPEAQIIADSPIWQRYIFTQDSATHYAIAKQTQPGCSRVLALQGTRTNGAVAVNDALGGVLLGVRNCWQKYPAGLEVSGLAEDSAQVTAWFYSPEAQPYDFSHYDTKSYQQTMYEGYPDVRASAYGIAVTSNATLQLSGQLPDLAALQTFGKAVQQPAVYAAAPEYYHAHRVMGYWAMPQTATPTERWLEQQLKQAFEFYQQQQAQRNWYGLFNYGDFRHSYDAVRHTWQYDMGGYAWDNTELLPTYWLWLYFLRTGRGDVFDMAEALTQHTQDVDVYHFGPLRGLGSRHNVEHWGDSCKEARIAMAGHHRAYYYLTGNLRTGDVLDDATHTAEALLHVDDFMRRPSDAAKQTTVIRTGPDWVTLVSNWLTAYERTLDQTYLDKILTGLHDIQQAPLGLVSGPDFEFTPATGHMRYIGEVDDTPNMHLLMPMGGTYTLLELRDYVHPAGLGQLLADFASYYVMTPQQRQVASHGLIQHRDFAWPYFNAALLAFAADRADDPQLAKLTWHYLLGALWDNDGATGFKPQAYAPERYEIPWVSTNFTAQWAVNTMVCLEFIQSALPDDLAGVAQAVATGPANAKSW